MLACRPAARVKAWSHACSQDSLCIGMVCMQHQGAKIVPLPADSAPFRSRTWARAPAAPSHALHAPSLRAERCAPAPPPLSTPPPAATPARADAAWKLSSMTCGVAERGGVRWGVVWCGVAWRGVVWSLPCGTSWHDMMWCGACRVADPRVMRCGVAYAT